MMVTENEYYEAQAKFKREIKALIPKVEYATVIGLTNQGKPILQFTGEKTPSQKTYVCLKHYSPKIGDRVILINDVIQGGWST